MSFSIISRADDWNCNRKITTEHTSERSGAYFHVVTIEECTLPIEGKTVKFPSDRDIMFKSLLIKKVISENRVSESSKNYYTYLTHEKLLFDNHGIGLIYYQVEDYSNTLIKREKYSISATKYSIELSTLHPFLGAMERLNVGLDVSFNKKLLKVQFLIESFIDKQDTFLSEIAWNTKKTFMEKMIIDANISHLVRHTRLGKKEILDDYLFKK